ncbi:MAG: metalloregulator ArsR/SmtB family transcription factor [Nitrospiraceae bacterium]|nr:metalloregulator ArsR/SmtB family transcription factor [Nitrospiraceae bacterium]
MDRQDRRTAVGSHPAKSALFDAVAEVAGALATGRRLEIVDLLNQGERSVDEIAREIGQSSANTSHHLRSLARAGLLRQRREGTRIYYRLSGPAVDALWDALREVAEGTRDDLARLQVAYVGDLSEVSVVSRDKLAQMMRDAEVVVIDVRPEVEYLDGHITNAISIPITELESRISELPAGRQVVAYCRGRYCAFAPAAVRLLGQYGVSASRLEEGFPEWRRAGLPVSSGRPG